MKTLWKGAVSFGLVNIPINMYAATEHKDIRFHYLHRECLTPVQYRKYCSTCQKEITAEEIVKGYEYHKGSYVVIQDEDLERIPTNSTKTIDILDFVELSEVDPVYYDKSYHLQASPGGEKAYALLVKAMQATDKIAVARVMIRSKSSLAVIRIHDQWLMMETIFYPDEIRVASSLHQNAVPVELHDNEVKMAVSLIDNLSTHFDPGKYQDNYRQALWEMITAKVNDQELVSPTSPVRPSNIVDLMDALRESIRLSEKNVGGPGTEKAATPAKSGKKRKTSAQGRSK